MWVGFYTCDELRSSQLNLSSWAEKTLQPNLFIPLAILVSLIGLRLVLDKLKHWNLLSNDFQDSSLAMWTVMYSNGPRLKSKQSQSIHKINNQYDTLISIYLIWSKPATRKKKVLMQVSNAWLLRGRNNALIVELLLMIIS